MGIEKEISIIHIKDQIFKIHVYTKSAWQMVTSLLKGHNKITGFCIVAGGMSK